MAMMHVAKPVNESEFTTSLCGKTFWPSVDEVRPIREIMEKAHGWNKSMCPVCVDDMERRMELVGNIMAR